MECATCGIAPCDLPDEVSADDVFTTGDEQPEPGPKRRRGHRAPTGLIGNLWHHPIARMATLALATAATAGAALVGGLAIGNAVHDAPSRPPSAERPDPGPSVHRTEAPEDALPDRTHRPRAVQPSRERPTAPAPTETRTVTATPLPEKTTPAQTTPKPSPTGTGTPSPGPPDPDPNPAPDLDAGAQQASAR